MSTGQPIPQQGAYTYGPQGRKPRRPVGRTWAFRGLGLIIAIIVHVALVPAEMSADARWVATIVSLMAVWWMTEAIPLSATAMLPLVLFPVFTAVSIADAAKPYANPIVFLFLGGFLIAIAMQKWNLHRRFALVTITLFGTQPRRIVLGMMVATAFLSMWVSNTATTLMMLPIGMSVLTLVIERNAAAATSHEDGSSAQRLREKAEQIAAQLRAGKPIGEVVQEKTTYVFGVGLLLAIAWSASIGGLGTLLGSPPNAIVAGYIQTELGIEIGFADWMQLGLPTVIVFIALAWVLITRVLFRSNLGSIPGGREAISEQLEEMGPMTRGEKLVLAVFCSAAFLWVVPGLLTNFDSIAEAMPWLDSMNDTVIAIAAGIAMFFIPGDKEGNMLLAWEDAENGLPWGVLLLFGGGLSLAAAVKASGLDAWFGSQVSGLGALPMILLVASVVCIVIFLTEVTSNTATAATFIPVLGGVAIGIGADSLTLLIPAAFAATCAFMLPVGTPPNAIVFGTGAVKITEMARGGIVLNLVGVVLVTLMTALLGPWALGLRF